MSDPPDHILFGHFSAARRQPHRDNEGGRVAHKHLVLRYTDRRPRVSRAERKPSRLLRLVFAHLRSLIAYAFAAFLAITYGVLRSNGSNDSKQAPQSENDELYETEVRQFEFQVRKEGWEEHKKDSKLGRIRQGVFLGLTVCLVLTTIYCAVRGMHGALPLAIGGSSIGAAAGAAAAGRVGKSRKRS